jgi:hypothetical protein
MGGNDSRLTFDPKFPKQIRRVMHRGPIGFAPHDNGDQTRIRHNKNKAMREEERKMYPTGNNRVAFLLTFFA